MISVASSALLVWLRRVCPLRLIFWIGVVALFSATTLIAGRYAQRASMDSLRQDAAPKLEFYAAGLESVLERYEHLPKVVALSPEVHALFDDQLDADKTMVVNRYLQSVNERARSMAVFVMNTAGLTLASSNWNHHESFVGHNFDFRPYFQEARNNRIGRFYAVGALTKVPGYFIACPVVQRDRVIGVVVAKVGLNDLEEAWGAAREKVAVVDANGVIFLSSQPAWRYKHLTWLSPEVTNYLARTRQYINVAPLGALGKTSGPGDSQVLSLSSASASGTASVATDYLLQSRPVSKLGWQMILLSDIEVTKQSARVTALLTALTFGLLIFALLYLRQRLRRIREAAEARQALQAAHDQLEVKVAERTEALQIANEHLEREVEQRREAEKLTDRLAHYDMVTGLPNRVLLSDRLNGAVTRASRARRAVAVMFIDIDRFKNVNDTLGHHVGDQLLVLISKRLVACVRRGDTVARQGGDEFMIVLESVRDRADACFVAQKVLDICADPVMCEGMELHVTVSIGISMFPEHGREADALTKSADIAMYRAKACGRNNYQLFCAEMDQQLTERMLLENDLHRALECDEFVLYFQPFINLDSGRLCGLEALIRWRHPRLGVLGPDKFIGLAEDSGLIVRLGQWTLREACRQFAAIRASGVGFERLSINLSARQLQDKGLLGAVAGALDSSGLEPDRVELEVTESSFMSDVAQNAKLLQSIRDMGVRIAIDDFGTGYSSFSYLKHLPVDVLKIDRSFVRDLDLEQNADIVDAMISLAHLLGLGVTAEGVETGAQLRYLRAHRCDLVQGYLFAAPAPMEAVVAWSRHFNARNLLTFDMTDEPRAENVVTS